MSYKCNKCGHISFNDIQDDLNPISDDIICSECWAKHSAIIIPCLYCSEDNEDNLKESTHFLCEECWVWMCDDCYHSDVEHVWHYHEVWDSCEDELYDKLVNHFWHSPAYICEKCLDKIEN